MYTRISFPRFQFVIFTLLFQFKHCVTGIEENGTKFKVHKCCPAGESILYNGDPGSLGCFNYSVNSRKWRGFFYDERKMQRLSPDQETMLNINYRHKELSCESVITLTQDFSKNYKLLSDGRVVSYCRACPCQKWQPVKEEFCIDGLTSEVEVLNPDYSAIDYSGSEENQILFVCPPNKTASFTIDYTNTNVQYIFLWTFFISSFFYLMILIVYILLWERHNIHGLTVTGLVMSRCFMCFFMGLAHLFEINGYQHPLSPISFQYVNGTGVFCIAGILAHFFVLSAFTWLNILCCDIWLTFRKVTPMVKKTKFTKTHFGYGALSLGLPFVIVSISLILNEIYKDPDTEFWIPDYGDGVCFVIGCARGVYIFSIIGILLSFSFMFWILTFWKIYNYRRGTGALLEHAKGRMDTKGYVLYGKIGLLMGATWILEFVSWAVTPDADSHSWYWIPIDIFNVLLSSMFIFIMLICKKEILDQLKEKYKFFRGEGGTHSKESILQWRSWLTWLF